MQRCVPELVWHQASFHHVQDRVVCEPALAVPVKLPHLEGTNRVYSYGATNGKSRDHHIFTTTDHDQAFHYWQFMNNTRYLPTLTTISESSNYVAH